MKTTATAINRAVYVLTHTDNGVEVPVYKRTAPTEKTLPAEYIVVNSLPVGKGVLQACVINANYHCKDVGPGMAYSDKLEAGQEAVMSRLDSCKDSEDGIFVYFESEETIADTKRGEHYSNMRFKVQIINK